MKIRLHSNASSTQKDSTCNFSVQAEEREFTKSCDEDKEDSFIGNASLVPTPFAFVSKDLEIPIPFAFLSED